MFDRQFRAWFDANPDALCVAAVAPEPAPRQGADRYRLAEPAHVPRYYGIPIQRPHSRVVFCLDVSQSMYGRGIEQARGELTRTLSAFPSSYAFEIIAFNEHLRAFAGELVPAHPVVKARAIQWLRALETISYTNLYDAVETAFADLEELFRAADRAGKEAVVEILGSADSQGSQDHNLDLARRRALGVQSVLVALGLSDNRLRVSAEVHGQVSHQGDTIWDATYSRSVSFRAVVTEP